MEASAFTSTWIRDRDRAVGLCGYSEIILTFSEMRNSGVDSAHFSSVIKKLEVGYCCTRFSGIGFLAF